VLFQTYQITLSWEGLKTRVVNKGMNLEDLSSSQEAVEEILWPGEFAHMGGFLGDWGISP
jgi:hypothetical protein